MHQVLLVVAAGALLRSQLTTKRVRVRRQEATQDELDTARQQLYVNHADGSKDILVPFRRAISRVRARCMRRVWLPG